MTHSPFYQTAVDYLNKGIAPLPFEGKRTTTLPNGHCLPWAVYQKRLPTLAELIAWEHKGYFKNIGLVCGSVSELVVIDLDGDNAIDLFHEKFPSVDTFTVNTGSGHGQHVYFRIDGTHKSTSVRPTSGGLIDVLADGKTATAPPSIHPVTGQPYIIADDRPIRRIESAELNRILAWMNSLKPPLMIAPKSPMSSAPLPTKEERWAVAALQRESFMVRTAPQSQRNNTLNRSAFKMGQLVGSNMLSHLEVERALLAAARIAGLDEYESVATIKSGMSAGIRSPRSQHGR